MVLRSVALFMRHRPTPSKTPDSFWRKRKFFKLASLCNQRLEAACEEHGFTFNLLRESLIRSNVLLNRKILVDLAVWEPRTFKCLTDFAWTKAKSEGLNGINELGDPPSGVILKPMPVRSVQTTHFGRKILGCSTIALAFVKCEGLFDSERLKTENLSHEQCIKQACLHSVNSASTLLVTTASTLLDFCSNYKDSLNQILFLLEAVQTVEGDNPELWDTVVEVRAQVNKAKAAVNKLTLYMENVEKVVTATTEAAFLAGAEYMCSTLCEQLDSAQREIKIQFGELKKLEEDYLKIQQEIVSKKEKDKSKGKKKEIINTTKMDSNILNH
ncbi:hypothetical protein RUM44_010500 [Polyplax serrata]|uniref:Direct IAP-binding protein with low pI n=1 Tax=Polyplax serrata TaxID=468196 RepID=A0ABR1AVR1_POLSC